MSQRGSFVTEYVYCKQCFQVLRDVLVQNDKFLKGVVIPSYAEGYELPIIAGKIGGLYGGEELHVMGFEIGNQLNEKLCHPVRIAVIPEWGEGKCFTFGPGHEDNYLAPRKITQGCEQVDDQE